MSAQRSITSVFPAMVGFGYFSLLGMAWSTAFWLMVIATCLLWLAYPRAQKAVRHFQKAQEAQYVANRGKDTPMQ